MTPYPPGESHDTLVSVSWDKYRDIRLPWVGRYPNLRVVQVTDAGVVLAPRNNARVWISLINDDAANVVYLNLGEAAVLNSSLRLNPGGSSIVFDRNMPWSDFITAITGAGLTANVLVCEVSQVVLSGRGEE